MAGNGILDGVIAGTLDLVPRYRDHLHRHIGAHFLSFGLSSSNLIQQFLNDSQISMLENMAMDLSDTFNGRIHVGVRELPEWRVKLNVGY